MFTKKSKLSQIKAIYCIYARVFYESNLTKNLIRYFQHFLGKKVLFFFKIQNMEGSVTFPAHIYSYQEMQHLLRE